MKNMTDDITFSKQTAIYIVRTLVSYCRQAFNSDYDPRTPLAVVYDESGGHVDRIVDPDIRVWVETLVFFTRYLAGLFAQQLDDDDLQILDGPP